MYGGTFKSLWVCLLGAAIVQTVPLHLEQTVLAYIQSVLCPEIRVWILSYLFGLKLQWCALD